LSFVVLALPRVLESFPQINVLYDAARGVLVRHRAVHVGIATQTPDGLKVPVVRNAQDLDLWQVGAEIRRLADRARSNQATREELVGSTITVTSLGKLGGIASTPIINAPEVAIIGLNKAVERPVVHGGAIGVRRIMNLSSSFDHRFVDGYDAAAMIQALKERLEHPATIFIGKVKSP
jgi:2-oxoisovalerate dehydrogenase E2 component (dihydrolipoyl transacylase)